MGVLEDREVIVAGLSFICLLFALARKQELKRIPGYRWLLMAFSLKVVSHQLTVVEHLVPALLASILNVAEHLASLAHSALLMIWVIMFWYRRKRSTL